VAEQAVEDVRNVEDGKASELGTRRKDAAGWCRDEGMQPQGRKLRATKARSGTGTEDSEEEHA
jgi:hypothetical protein